jgi:hypothetical protein
MGHSARCEARNRQPHLRAITARPFLPKYFPGHETYLWMDADTWLQEWYPIDWYVAAAADGRLAIAPQVDRAYRHPRGVLNWRMERLRAFFGPRPWRCSIRSNT